MALTNIVGTLLLPDGTPYNGNLLISWGGIPWQADDGTLVPAGPGVAYQVKNGEVDIELQPTDGTTVPTPIYYYVLYRGTGPQTTPQVWSVPTSGSPVPLSSVIIPATSGSPIASGIVTLNGLATPTQLLARTNDTNVTLTITSAVSTHTFALGWTGQTSAARGGTGQDTSASTGVPKITAGTWSTDAAAQDLTNWPAGVSNTEVGYLDGVTSAIQTQLDAKASSAALANYLPLTGGTLTGTTTFQQASANDFGFAVGVQKRGTTGDATSAIKNNAELGYWSFAGWNGSAYQRGGLVIMYATEDWSGSQSGTQMQFYTTRQGTTSNALNALFDRNGNLVVGEIGAASTYRVDIVNSGADGTFRVYDQGVSGVTKAVVRAGVSQGSVNLQEWQNGAGAVLAAITSAGNVVCATKTPSSASDTGESGTVCWDSSYIYVCIATNTWKRVAISTW